MLILTLTSCGPGSGISENNEDPNVCSFKDATLADTSKNVPRTESEINGQILFKDHCKQCHAPMDIKPCIGRSLRGVTDRLPSIGNYFKTYIQNSDSLKRNGDPYANKLESENKADYEHNFKFLTDKQVQDILNYTKITIDMN